MTQRPSDLVRQVAAILDELGIQYALGGSWASSAFGEPRSTVDIDFAVFLSATQGDQLLERSSASFDVPIDFAREAIRTSSSFNLIPKDGGMKVDIFVLGDGLLDRLQIDRRVRVDDLWFTAPEVQVLRKLEWYRDGGRISDRQWRDVLSLIEVSGSDFNLDWLRSNAVELGLGELLDDALDEAEPFA